MGSPKSKDFGVSIKVALDISPIKTGHSVRGIGAYTKNLSQELLARQDQNFKLEFFDDPASPPPADVIHYPYFDLFKRTLPLAKAAKRVVTIHDVIPLVFPTYFPAGIRGYINLFFQKRALKKSDAVICDSKTSKKDIVDKLSVSPDKIHLVYLAPSAVFVKLEAPDMMIFKKYKLPKEFALYVGDVNWNKNLINLLAAVKIAKTHLVLVGKAFTDSGLSETREINKKIRQFGIEDKITKTGFILDSDLVQIYNLAKVTVLPSYYEGFGLPVLESMACGTPAVCTDIASLSEIAKGAALFCSPQDPKDIAAKITTVFELSQQEYEKLSQKSQEHAQQYSWTKTAQQTIKVYESLF